MCRLSRLAAAALGLLGFAVSAPAQTAVADLPLAGGASERVLFAAPAAPAAILVMLPGGDGAVDIDRAGGVRRGDNFLVRTRALWLQQGVAVEIPEPPAGHSLLGQRHTPEYAEAIGRAVDFAAGKARAPIWLVGTSQGSTAAANGAGRLRAKIAGVVLTSSVTRPSRSGETLFDDDLAAIAVPALLVANRGDGCPASPPAEAQRIADALTGAPKKEIVFFDSSEIRAAPCRAMSPHGYLGIEPQVVGRVVGWIRAAQGR